LITGDKTCSNVPKPLALSCWRKLLVHFSNMKVIFTRLTPTLFYFRDKRDGFHWWLLRQWSLASWLTSWIANVVRKKCHLNLSIYPRPSTCCEIGELLQRCRTLCSVARRHFLLEVDWVINMLETDSLSQWIITVQWTKQRHMGNRIRKSRGFFCGGGMGGKKDKRQSNHM